MEMQGKSKQKKITQRNGFLTIFYPYVKFLR